MGNGDLLVVLVSRFFFLREGVRPNTSPTSPLSKTKEAKCSREERRQTKAKNRETQAQPLSPSVALSTIAMRRYVTAVAWDMT